LKNASSLQGVKVYLDLLFGISKNPFPLNPVPPGLDFHYKETFNGSFPCG